MKKRVLREGKRKDQGFKEVGLRCGAGMLDVREPRSGDYDSRFACSQSRSIWAGVAPLSSSPRRANSLSM